MQLMVCFQLYQSNTSYLLIPICIMVIIKCKYIYQVMFDVFPTVLILLNLYISIISIVSIYLFFELCFFSRKLSTKFKKLSTSLRREINLQGTCLEILTIDVCFYTN